jgi:hypothetical protein
MNTLTTSPSTIWFTSPTAPALGTGPVSVQNGHLAVNGQRVTFFGCGVDFSAILGLCNNVEVNGVWTTEFSPAQQSVFQEQVANLAAIGIRAVRIHGLDNEGMPNIFASANGVTTSTTRFCSGAVQALDYFLYLLEQAQIRYVIELHYTRQLLPTDQPLQVTAAAVSALATECVTTSYGGAPIGTMIPWVALDPVTLQPLQMAYDAAILTHVNQYTGVAIGQSSALMAVQLENECSLVKNGGWGEPTNTPVLAAAVTASMADWCTAQGFTKSNQFGAAQHAQYWASVETAWLGARAANVRTLTHALIIPNTFYGDGPYAMLQSSLAVGDCLDAHFYSRYSSTDSNGFQNGRTGQTSPDARTRFSAVLAGCSWTAPAIAAGTAGANAGGKPLFVTEYGPQGQYQPFPLDPPAELGMDPLVATWQAIWQDVDALFFYSYAHAAIFSEGSPYQGVGPYDLRFVDPWMRAMRGCADLFHDLSLRPTTSVTVSPTGGMYGSQVTNAAGQSVFEQYGPYTDPALYAIPAGTKVQVAT